MPTITRWFRVTHDINSDPEIWELRELYGDRAGFVWLECLSIADRNSGVVGPNSDQTRNQLASKCRTSRVKVGLILDWSRVKGWLLFDSHIRVAKWRKYNKARDDAQFPSETTPRHTRHDSKTSSAETADLSVQELVDSWNESFKGKLPQVEWPLSTSRQRKAAARLREHKNLEFWQQVFNNLVASDFLMGKNNGTWRCTLDFLIANDTNCIKVYEGAYNGKTNQTYGH